MRNLLNHNVISGVIFVLVLVIVALAMLVVTESPNGTVGRHGTGHARATVQKHEKRANDGVVSTTVPVGTIVPTVVASTTTTTVARVVTPTTVAPVKRAPTTTTSTTVATVPKDTTTTSAPSTLTASAQATDTGEMTAPDGLHCTAGAGQECVVVTVRGTGCCVPPAGSLYVNVYDSSGTYAGRLFTEDDGQNCFLIHWLIRDGNAYATSSDSSGGPIMVPQSVIDFQYSVSFTQNGLTTSTDQFSPS